MEVLLQLIFFHNHPWCYWIVKPFIPMQNLGYILLSWIFWVKIQFREGLMIPVRGSVQEDFMLYVMKMLNPFWLCLTCCFLHFFSNSLTFHTVILLLFSLLNSIICSLLLHYFYVCGNIYQSILKIVLVFQYILVNKI